MERWQIISRTFPYLSFFISIILSSARYNSFYLILNTFYYLIVNLFEFLQRRTFSAQFWSVLQLPNTVLTNNWRTNALRCSFPGVLVLYDSSSRSRRHQYMEGSRKYLVVNRMFLLFTQFLFRFRHLLFDHYSLSVSDAKLCQGCTILFLGARLVHDIGVVSQLSCRWW